MIKKSKILIIFFVCALGASETEINTESKTEAVARTAKSPLRIIKQYSLPAKACVHITAQDAPIYIDTTSKCLVTVAVRLKQDEQIKKTKKDVCKGKMIHDDILHIVTKEQDVVERYYVSVPECASVTVVSKGDIHASIPYARIEARGHTVRTALATSVVTQIDETDRCYLQGLISNGKHFEHRPMLELDTQGDITINVSRNGGLGYGSYLLTQVLGKIKNSWQGLQELITE